jgi:CO/xanthine dehydrogenase Mo-binding subunit
MGGIEPANAVCRLERDGTLSIIVGTVDMSGTNTAFAQIASEAFGLPAGLIRVVNADTEAAPYAGSSGGSKITYTVGAAVEKAARDATPGRILAIAASRSRGRRRGSRDRRPHGARARSAGSLPRSPSWRAA